MALVHNRRGGRRTEERHHLVGLAVLDHLHLRALQGGAEAGRRAANGRRDAPFSLGRLDRASILVSLPLMDEARRTALTRRCNSGSRVVAAGPKPTGRSRLLDALLHRQMTGRRMAARED